MWGLVGRWGTREWARGGWEGGVEDGVASNQERNYLLFITELQW